MQLKETTIALLVLILVLLIVLFAGDKLPSPVKDYRNTILIVTLAGIVAWFVLFAVKKIMAVRSAMAIEKKLKAQAQDQISGARPDQQPNLQALASNLNEALAALKASKMGKGALYSLPWYIIIGPPGSGKSTALVESGLNFPYMSQGRKGVKGVGGTRNCDWWFTDQGILLDTAGRYTTELEDRDEWIGFLEMVKKTRKEKPINGALVCVAVSDLLQATDEELEAHAKNIRDRLDELTKRLELVFPVYLVFTKCDLLNGFVDFFEDMSKGDRSQVWGFTMPYVQQGSSNLQTKFEEECKAFYQRLNVYRLSALSTDRKIEKKRNIYSFPIQFALGHKRLGEFIGLLFRANPFQESAILRGVYFTSGTQEGLPIDKVVGAMSEAFGISDESASFVSQTQEKKSYFLNHLFTKIIFPDQTLAQLASGVAKKKRLVGVATIGGSALGFLVFSILFVVSFFANRSTFKDVQKRSEEFAKRDANTPPPLEKDLKGIESVRSAIQMMKDGPSFFERFVWVTPGNDDDAESIHGRTRKVYFTGVREIFLKRLGRVLENELSGWLNETGLTKAKLERLFEIVRTYQIACGKMEPDKKDPELHNRVLKDPRFSRAGKGKNLWIQSLPQDQLTGELEILGQRQLEYTLLEFFKKDAAAIARIPHYDESLVNKVLDLLKRGLWVEASYDDIRDFARQNYKGKYPDMDLVRLLGDSDGREVFRFKEDSAEGPVEGFFTQDCFDGYAHQAFQEHAETIVSKYVQLGIDDSLDKVRRQFYDRYTRDYRKEWDELLEKTELAPFGDTKGARDKLMPLAGITSKNSALLKFIVETWKGRRLVIDGKAEIENQKGTDWVPDPGLKTLNDQLWKKLDVFIKRTVGKESQRFRTYAVDDKLKDAVQLQESFISVSSLMEEIVRSNVETALVDAVLKIMQAPIRRSGEAVAAEARDEINKYWAETVQKHFRETLAEKYPFSPDPNNRLRRNPKAPDAGSKEFNDFFRPDELGIFTKASIYIKTLSEIKLFEQPLTPLLTPTEEYNRALQVVELFQNVLYRGERKDVVTFKFWIVSSSPQVYTKVEFRIGALTKDMKELVSYTWKDAWWKAGDKVSLTLKAAGQQDKGLFDGKGHWDVFRLCEPKEGFIEFKEAVRGGKEHEIVWTFLPNKTLTFTLKCDDAINPFPMGFFFQFECPERVAGE